MTTHVRRAVHRNVSPALPMLYWDLHEGYAWDVDAASTDKHVERLLEVFFKLELPEGSRAEFIEGEIVVSPPPGGTHEDIVSYLSHQIARNAASWMDFSGNKGLALASGGLCTKNYLIPDGVVAPRELRLFRDADPWMASEGVAMVVEVTSGRPDMGRSTKRHCYAKAGIPLYLLVDRARHTTTLFSEPDQGIQDYVQDTRMAFGKPIDLPEPFSFALDTSEF